MTYVYLIGTGIYALLWILFYLKRKDLRRKILFSSLFAAPLGISEKLFIPQYWTPKFQTINITDELFLESFLFCFFLGGVVSVFYQVLFKEKNFKFKKINPYLTTSTLIIFLLYFFRPFNINPMYYVLTSLFLGSFIVMYYLGKKDSIKIIYSSIINTTFYSIFYFFLWYTFPQLPASYDIDKLSGILFGGIPIEEFLWIMSYSLFWTPLYEIWNDSFKKTYRQKKRTIK